MPWCGVRPIIHRPPRSLMELRDLNHQVDHFPPLAIVPLSVISTRLAKIPKCEKPVGDHPRALCWNIAGEVKP